MTVIYTAQSAAPQPKTRGPLLPLLIVLFVISYAILTLLVVQQGQTIEAQRSLLREMLKDSRQLATLKDKLAHDVAVQNPDKPGARTNHKEAVSGAPANAPSKAPSKDTQPQGKSAKIKKEAPEKPAADLQDVRRSTREI